MRNAKINEIDLFANQIDDLEIITKIVNLVNELKNEEKKLKDIALCLIISGCKFAIDVGINKETIIAKAANHINHINMLKEGFYSEQFKRSH